MRVTAYTQSSQSYFIYILRRLICFFLNCTPTTDSYTLSLHDALPILFGGDMADLYRRNGGDVFEDSLERSEEHTSELQSRLHLVCRLLLEKKKIRYTS